MIRRRFRLLLPMLFLISAQVGWAQAGSSSKQKRIVFDISSHLGTGSLKTSADVAAPTLGSFGLGVSLGFNIKRFSLGVASDYRILTQYSSVEDSVGNRRGNFLSPISLFVRLNFEKIKFGIILINSGQYDLMNKTADGKKVSYTKPSGFRFHFGFKNFKKFTPELFYESVDFSEKNVDGVVSTLSDKMNYGSYGLGVRYEF